jgi:RNA polymerase sigma-70 factor (ECF subfamily)
MIIDKSIVLAMKQKDEAAFASCYQLLSSYVYSIVLRICGVAAVAEEIMQESFIQAFSSIEQLQQDTHFTPWIKRIAFNKTMAHLRQAKEQVSLTEQHLDSLSFDLFDEQLIQQNELAYLLGQLTAQERLIVWMFVVEGYSHKEIATLSNKTESYSKSIVSRSLAKMREIDRKPVS